MISEGELNHLASEAANSHDEGQRSIKACRFEDRIKDLPEDLMYYVDLPSIYWAGYKAGYRQAEKDCQRTNTNNDYSGGIEFKIIKMDGQEPFLIQEDDLDAANRVWNDNISQSNELSEMDNLDVKKHWFTFGYGSGYDTYASDLNEKLITVECTGQPKVITTSKVLKEINKYWNWRVEPSIQTGRLKLSDEEYRIAKHWFTIGYDSRCDKQFEIKEVSW